MPDDPAPEKASPTSTVTSAATAQTPTARPTSTPTATATPAPSAQTPTTSPTARPVSPPVASFSVDVSAGSAPLTVKFSETSSGQVTSWQWDFGDGSSSTEQHPVHEYTKAGAHTLRLTAVGPGGSDSVVLERGVEVAPGALASVAVEPETATLVPGCTQQFEAVVIDQFGNSITSLTRRWEASAGGITTAVGLFTAGGVTGTFRNALELAVVQNGNVLAATASVTVAAPQITGLVLFDERAVAGMNVQVFTGGGPAFQNRVLIAAARTDAAGAYAISLPGPGAYNISVNRGREGGLEVAHGRESVFVACQAETKTHTLHLVKPFQDRSPLLGSKTTTTPTLSWNAIAEADSYRVFVYLDIGGSYEQVFMQMLPASETSVIVTTALTPGLLYRWLVQATNAAGQWSVLHIVAIGGVSAFHPE